MSPDTISTESYAKVGSNSKVKDPTTGVTGGGPLPATTLKFDAVNWMSYVIGADFADVAATAPNARIPPSNAA